MIYSSYTAAGRCSLSTRYRSWSSTLSIHRTFILRDHKEIVLWLPLLGGYVRLFGTHVLRQKVMTLLLYKTPLPTNMMFSTKFPITHLYRSFAKVARPSPWLQINTGVLNCLLLWRTGQDKKICYDWVSINKTAYESKGLRWMLLSDNLQSSDTTILCCVAYACFHTAVHCAPYLDIASVVANTIYPFFSMFYYLSVSIPQHWQNLMSDIIYGFSYLGFFSR